MAYAVTVTVTDASASPLVGVAVSMDTAAGHFNATTNGSGVATFSLSAVTYTYIVGAVLAGYSYTPTSHVVSGAGNIAVTMAILTAPASTDLVRIGYELHPDAFGGTYSLTTYECSTIYSEYWMEQLYGATDGNAIMGWYLKIANIDYGMLDKSAVTLANTKLICRAIPAWKWDTMLINGPAWVTYEYGNLDFTLMNNGQWKWSNGDAVLGDMHLLKRVTKVTVRARRAVSSLTMATYASYNNCVNSVAFLGAAAKCALFLGAEGVPRLQANGAFCYDMTAVFECLAQPWEQHWRDTPGVTPAWDTPKNGSTTQYPDSADFTSIVPAIWG
jgi:hypothetical protein